MIRWYCLLLFFALATLSSKEQTLTTIAGNGVGDYSGDGGTATSSTLSAPTGICKDNHGNIFIADNANHVIRKIDSLGIISTIAGTGEAGYSGDGGLALSAQLNFPYKLCIDKYNNLYISDQQNNVIRKIDSSGIITTLAGNGTKGYSGDGGPAIQAQLNDPMGIAVDNRGNLYIAEGFNQRIRKVNADGVIETIAGSGSLGNRNGGYSGDGGPANQATLNMPADIVIDSYSNIYFTEEYNSDIRKIDSTGTITTIAGKSTLGNGYSGDGGAATDAQLNSPLGIAMDGIGNLYVVDESNYLIRKITSGGIITTIAGSGIQSRSLTGNGNATQISLGSPNGVFIDNDGTVYFTDDAQNVIRKIVF